MARRARCWRVRSVFTPQVSASEAEKVNTHAALVKVVSGQLPFLGLRMPDARHLRRAVAHLAGQRVAQLVGRLDDGVRQRLQPGLG